MQCGFLDTTALTAAGSNVANTAVAVAGNAVAAMENGAKHYRDAVLFQVLCKEGGSIMVLLLYD